MLKHWRKWVAAGLLLGSAAGSTEAAELKKLTMVVFGPPSLGAFLPPIIKAKKFDEKNGLAIEFVERPPDAYSVQFNSGEFQVGGSASLLTLGLADLRGVKVTYLFNLYDYWSYLVTSRPDVKTLKDIEGKDLAAAKGTSTPMPNEITPPVAIIMGSRSDWPTMKAAADALTSLGVAYEAKVVSAHRTPERLFDFAKGAQGQGFKVIIAGAGGAAHLPGMAASMTNLPVLGVPVQSKALSGLDSLLSIVQMPGGVPVATLAIGEAGAKNAGLLAAQILALSDPALAERLAAFRVAQTDSVAESVED